jgi:hypothetical protein
MPQPGSGKLLDWLRMLQRQRLRWLSAHGGQVMALHHTVAAMVGSEVA